MCSPRGDCMLQEYSLSVRSRSCPRFGRRSRFGPVRQFSGVIPFVMAGTQDIPRTIGGKGKGKGIGKGGGEGERGATSVRSWHVSLILSLSRRSAPLALPCVREKKRTRRRDGEGEGGPRPPRERERERERETREERVS